MYLVSVYPTNRTLAYFEQNRFCLKPKLIYVSHFYVNQLFSFVFLHFVFALPISALAAQTAQNAESRTTPSLFQILKCRTGYLDWEYHCTMNLYLALNLAYLLEKLGSLKLKT